MNRRIQVGNDDKGRPVMQPVANVWLSHRCRKQFIDGVTFDPSKRKAPNGVLNLWQGFTIQPQPGSWTRMQTHIRNVICKGNDEHFNYLMDWMARLIQRPAEQGEVAVVLHGGEGAGKGTIARALQRIFGQHGLAISNPKHLTGNFNSHLRDCVFLFADEAFYAGDRSHVGVLKAIITEPYLTIEGKYQNAVQAPNFLHLMMASNEEWIVPAALDARRFFVLEVSEAKKDDHAYFATIWGEMENGGYEAMLHELLHRDLTFFNPRRVPVTEGLQTQRKLSLGTSEAWWMDVLHRGYVYCSRLGLEEYFAAWHEEMSTEVLFASYEAFAIDRRERHPMGRETFGRFMKSKARAKPKRLLNAVIGERIAEVANIHGGPSRRSVLTTHPRPSGYSLGTLRASRESFLAATALRGDWPADDDDEAAPA